jgi:hypothetical protein
MGQSQSKRMDRYVATYEREFERIEQDLVRVLQRRERGRAVRAALSLWSAAVVVASVAVAAALVQRVQRAAPGEYSAAQHAARTAGGLCLPFAAAALRWLTMLLLGAADARASRRAAALEQGKRALVRELKDACRFDTARRLLVKYDPDERKQQMQHMMQQQQQQRQQQQQQKRRAAGPLTQHQQHQHQQQRQPGPNTNARPQDPPPPALLVTAGAAAASAVAGAGRAVLPLIDRLANTLIADNPVLLEDVRAAHAAVAEAESVAAAAARENEALRARVAELEAMLGFEAVAPLALGEESGDGGGGEEQQEQREEDQQPEATAVSEGEGKEAVEAEEEAAAAAAAATGATGGSKGGGGVASTRRRRAAIAAA